MGVWYLYDAWWILPVFGLLVGYATNWLAIKLIFEPVKPIKIFGKEFQGLFITRQNEVSSEYAAMLANEIFTFDRIFAAIVNGPTKEKFVDMISIHAKNAIDEGVGISKPMVKFLAGKRHYDKMKDLVVEKTLKELPSSVKPVFPYAEEAMDLETVFREKMQALSPPDFVDFLRPVFQEDELKLILVGGVLGMMVGVFQYVYVFGGAT
jgi:uncharacterized membrane protein YheB (UPF0754 family)